MRDIGGLAASVGSLSRRGLEDEMKRRTLFKQVEDFGRNNPGVLDSALQMYSGRRPGAAPFSLDSGNVPMTKMTIGGATRAIPTAGPAGTLNQGALFGAMTGAQSPGGGGGSSSGANWNWGSGKVGGPVNRKQERLDQLDIGTAENDYAGSNLAREDAVGASAQRDIEQRKAYEEGASIVREFSAGVPEGQRDRYEYGKALMLYKDPVKARAAANAMKDTLGDRNRMTQPEATVLAALVKEGKGKGGATDPEKKKTQLQNSIDVLERMLTAASFRGDTQSEGVIASQIEKKKAELDTLGAAPSTGTPEEVPPAYVSTNEESWRSDELIPAAFTNDPATMARVIAQKNNSRLMAAADPVGPQTLIPAHEQRSGGVPVVAGTTAPAKSVDPAAAVKAKVDADIAAVKGKTTAPAKNGEEDKNKKGKSKGKASSTPPKK